MSKTKKNKNRFCFFNMDDLFLFLHEIVVFGQKIM